MANERTILLITGANTGLGYQTVRALCQSEHSYEILIGGRSLVKAQQASKNVVKEFPSTKSKVSPIQVDIEDDDSIEAACAEVKSRFGRIDVLLNNAGAQLDPRFHAGELSMRQLWNMSWNVNTAGTQIMTATFCPLLLESKNPRLLFITSGTSTLAGTENLEIPCNKSPGKGWPKRKLPGVENIPAYRSSKAGMNMMMREWYRMLHDDGVKVWCISPGYLATGLGAGSDSNKQAGAQDPGPAGEFIRSVVEGERDNDCGKVVMAGGKTQSW